MRTTALYWMNIHHGGNDDDSDVGSILTGKVWLEKPQKPKPESEAPVRLNLEDLPELLAPNSLASEPYPDYLTKTKYLESQLSQIQQEKDKEITRLKTELSQEKEQSANLQQDLTELSEQNNILQHNLSEKNQIINQLTQDLASERKKLLIVENNLLKEKALLFTQKQNSQSLQENNANLKQKLSQQEQNHINLQTAYQITLKDKQTAEKQVNYYEKQLKTIAKMFHQWQKINHYQQLEKQRNEFQAQIIQPPPWKIPPWKISK